MKRALIFLTLILIGIGAFGYVITYGVYKQWNQQKALQAKINHELEEAKSKQEPIKMWASQREMASTRAKQAMELIPDKENREQFVSLMDSAATSSSVSLTALSFIESNTPKAKGEDDTEGTKAKTPAKTTKASKTKTDSQKLQWQATVSGSYANLYQFLYRIQNLSRYAVVSSINLTAQDAVLYATLNGEIYTKPEPKIAEKLPKTKDLWTFLEQRQSPAAAPTATTGRADPFVAY